MSVAVIRLTRLDRAVVAVVARWDRCTDGPCTASKIAGELSARINDRTSTTADEVYGILVGYQHLNILCRDGRCWRPIDSDRCERVLDAGAIVP